jgi:hypothetical protein
MNDFQMCIIPYVKNDKTYDVYSIIVKVFTIEIYVNQFNPQNW